MFSGIAGVIWAATILADILNEDWPIHASQNAVEYLNACGVMDAELPVWKLDPINDLAYLGCAHGSAGIAMALACWGKATGQTTYVDKARKTFRSIALHGRTEDGLALRIGPHDTQHHAVGNWCHGVAGYLWALLIAFGDDPALSAEINWAVDVLNDTMSVGTATYCHGLAGQLELWHLLEEIPRFQRLAQCRAGKVARALRVMHVKVDGYCTWVSDDPLVITPDLWVGFLGPAAALSMHAAGIRWPLFSASWLLKCAQTLPNTH